MGILDTIRTRSTDWLVSKVVSRLADEDLASRVVSGLQPRQAAEDYFAGDPMTKLELSALVSPLVKPNIDMIAATGSTSQIAIQKHIEGTETWDEITNHELERLLNVSPFKDVGANLAWRFTFTWLMLRGEAYWMLIANGFGELVGLVPIPAYMMKPVPWNRDMGGPPRLIGHFLYAPSDPNKPYILPSELVLYHRLPNPIYLHRGWSPIASYHLMIQTVGHAERFDLDDYKNGLALAKIFSLRRDTKPKDYKQALADFDAARADGRRDQFVRAGDLDVKDVVQRRGETGQNVHSRAKEQADRVLGVPKGVRGDDVTFASAKVAQENFRRDTIDSLLALRDEDINGKIVYPLYGEGLRAKSGSVVPVDPKEQREAKEFEQRSWMVDEVRAEQGMEEHPDPSIGKAIMYDIKPVESLMVPGAGAPAIPATTAMPGIEPEEEEVAEQEEASEGEFGKSLIGHSMGVQLKGRCPLCTAENTVFQYEDHKNLCLCGNCGQTFDMGAGWRVEELQPNSTNGKTS